MYSSIREANEHAIAEGETDFLDCDSLGIDCDAGAAILPADTTITIANLTAGEQINRYDLLQIVDEYCLVTGVNGTTITVTRGFGDTVPAAYASGQKIYVKSQLKVKLIARATREFVTYHKQFVTAQVLWLEANLDMRKLCAVQVIYMARYIEESELSERVQTMTLNDYSDGVLSIKYPGGRIFAPGVKEGIQYIARLLGVRIGGFQRG